MPSTILFVELVVRLQLVPAAQQLIRDSRRAITVLRAKDISDDWKEKFAMRFSWIILRDSVVAFFLLIVAAAGFLACHEFLAAILDRDMSMARDGGSLLSLVLATIVGTLYVALRWRRRVE